MSQLRSDLTFHVFNFQENTDTYFYNFAFNKKRSKKIETKLKKQIF